MTWLEEGRVYRFRTPDDALLALLLYATALGIDHREARELAGLAGPRTVQGQPARQARGARRASRWRRLHSLPPSCSPAARAARARGGGYPLVAEAKLPKPWQIAVDVRNGSGNITYTRRVASRVGALGYRVARVGRAEPLRLPGDGGLLRAGRRARGRAARPPLGVGPSRSPAATTRRRLVVVVGPQRGPPHARCGVLAKAAAF